MTTADSNRPVDPADVAAASPTAAALLGTSSSTPTATGPVSAMPVVPVATGSSTGRYADVGTAVHVADDGTETVHLRNRVVPDPTRLATTAWETVGDGDRHDIVAARALGDPTLAWQLCDANLCETPDDLDVVGRRIRVTLPNGFPGAEHDA